MRRQSPRGLGGGLRRVRSTRPEGVRSRGAAPNQFRRRPRYAPDSLARHTRNEAFFVPTHGMTPMGEPIGVKLRIWIYAPTKPPRARRGIRRVRSTRPGGVRSREAAPNQFRRRLRYESYLRSTWPKSLYTHPHAESREISHSYLVFSCVVLGGRAFFFWGRSLFACFFGGMRHNQVSCSGTLCASWSPRARVSLILNFFLR